MGKVHAGRLAWRGTISFFVVRRKERLVTLALELKQKYGPQAYASVTTLANETGVKRAAAGISADERITALVNSAGFFALNLHSISRWQRSGI